MKQKTLFLTSIFLCFSIFVLSGCGSDEEPDKPITEPSKPEEPTFTKDEFVGSWNILSINDQAAEVFVDEVINGDEPDLEDRPKTKINNFSAAFVEDDSWSLNLAFEMLDFPEDPNKDDPEKAAKLKMTGQWTGEYSIEGSHLTLTISDSDVNLTTMPENLFEALFDTSEMSARQELLSKFQLQILLPFSKTFVTIKENKLTLESVGASTAVMILEKQ